MVVNTNGTNVFTNNTNAFRQNFFAVYENAGLDSFEMIKQDVAWFEILKYSIETDFSPFILRPLFQWL